MSMDVMATADGKIESVFPDGLDVPSTSAFVPVVVAHDLVFVAGFLAAWQPGDLGGIAPEAKVPEGHLWKGNRIQLEADYNHPPQASPRAPRGGRSALGRGEGTGVSRRHPRRARIQSSVATPFRQPWAGDDLRADGEPGFRDRGR
jgi:hypothetical protein